jgi:putative lipoic acid-binding regulatory protein
MIILAESEEKNDEYQIKFIKSSKTYFIKQEVLMNLLNSFQIEDLHNNFTKPQFVRLKTSGCLREKLEN